MKVEPRYFWVTEWTNRQKRHGWVDHEVFWSAQLEPSSRGELRQSGIQILLQRCLPSGRDITRLHLVDPSSWDHLTHHGWAAGPLDRDHREADSQASNLSRKRLGSKLFLASCDVWASCATAWWRSDSMATPEPSIATDKANPYGPIYMRHPLDG